MTPIQQLFLGTSSAVATKTYVDDIFNTQVYAGNGTSSNTQTTGIDMTEDFLLWTKRRSGGAEAHYLFDSKRTSGSNYISAYTNSEALGNSRGWITPTSTGYQINDNDNAINASGSTYASWSFKPTPGFFDIVEFSETGSVGTDVTVSHSLGSVPAMIIIKTTSRTSSWFTYHREAGASKYLALNGTIAAGNLSHSSWGPVTSTSFNFNSQVFGYGAGTEWIAYLFAGGESTAATARSVDFGSSNYISQPSNSDFNGIQAQAFTVEYWMNADAFSSSANGGSSVLGVAEPNTSSEYWSFGTKSTGEVIFYYYNGSVVIETTGITLSKGQWYHLALVHDGSNGFKIFVNGILVKSGTISGSITPTTPFSIGRVSNGQFDGRISNVRVVHSAVYTSSFKPPTEPLTNITNTKLLCCNNSSVTGSTVTPGTITATNSPTASTDSPFDDPAGFVFGENEDQGIIKCGSYIGNGSTTGPEIFLGNGWEPQWLLCKKIDNQGGGANTSNWHILDSMRGTGSGGANVADDQLLMPNLDNTEVTIELADFTSTGFKNTSNRDAWNYDGDKYIYMAIRRPDPLVQKPQLATDVFAMDTAASAVPRYSSGFPVDFAFKRRPATTESWYTGARLIGKNRGYTDATTAFSDNNGFVWDSNTHWPGGGGDDVNVYQAWMWKRHAGFDVVTVKPGTTGAHIPHNLNAVPEMVWAKARNVAYSWSVYHKGLNGGTNPEQYRLVLDDSGAESVAVNAWNDEAPTATHFTTGYWMTNNDMLCLLFSSVDGISKVGYFDGQSSDLTVTFGFQPRFLMVKRADSAGDWNVYDTTRGLVSGADKELRLNDTSNQSDHEVGDITSTGFTFACGGSHDTCSAGGKWIYYAHA